MPVHYDAVFIGAGHNGLTCAAYLAKAGLKVRLLERRDIVGGAAITEEFHPGFRNSTASYTVSLLNPKVIRDLRLAHHGLKIVERPFSNFLPLPDGGSFSLWPGADAARAELARFSARDATRLGEYFQTMESVATLLREMVLETPPRLAGGWGDVLDGLRLAGHLRKLPLAARRDALDLFTKSAGELLDWWFECEPLKAALGFDSMVGNFAGPYSPGSAYGLLHHAFGEVNGKRGIWGHALGGMGAITQAMLAEATAHGAVATTGAAVAQVRIRAGQASGSRRDKGASRAYGVTLADGTEIDARVVVANVNPKLLYGKLVAPEHLDDDFRSRIERWKCASGTLRMNVALSELPSFSCRPGTQVQPHHGAGIIIAPSLEYMDRAWTDARSLGWARAPIVEMLIPSTVDTSLAPAGAHVASLFCQHFNPVLPDGRSWDDAREAAADVVIETVNQCAPNFRASVIARKVLTPLDLERDFGLVGGDIFHGALSLDQLFAARPVLGYGDYRTPVKGLYLCGSGAHPGGGVTGAPGHNAAREILRDLRR
ncbi:MAG: NAD(P)/FAD-dependent oxidoreductase [Betaproteobacteria bacterium]|nr:NAD(P)/FAD-dependent oxidoreductase [Betaproteobacteria bacterium]